LDILLPTPQPWFEHLRVCTGTYYHDRQFIWKYYGNICICTNTQWL